MLICIEAHVDHQVKGKRAHLRTFEPQCVRRPALLLGHNVRHGLTATADARDADGRSLEFGDALVFGLCSGDDRPAIMMSNDWCMTLVDTRRETNLTAC